MGASGVALTQYPGWVCRTSGCYLPSCSPEPLDDNLTLYKLLDPDGSTASGYSTALDVMRNRLEEAGATLLLRRKLIGIYGLPNGSMALHWEGGGRTIVAHALLNLPRHALLALAADSLIFAAAAPRSRQLFNCSRALYQQNYTQAIVFP